MERRIRETSIKAYNEIRDEGLLSARRWEAYDILYHQGPMTANEVFQHAKLHGNPNYRHNTNARMTELRELGVVQEVGKRRCHVTGREVILWDVTAALPTKRPVVKTALAKARERIAELEEEISVLRFYGNKDGIAMADEELARRRGEK